MQDEAGKVQRKRPRWRRWALRAGLLIAGLLGGGGAIGCCVFSGPRYLGPRSDHFDGTRFVNQAPIEHMGPADVLRWQVEREQGEWRPITEADPGPPPPRSVAAGDMRVTWVGHATVLVQLDGKNILTDPVWSERVTPVSGIGPRRMHPPGIRFEDLPPIDAVVISHNHYDHLDLPTLRQLDERFQPYFFVGLGNGRLLTASGIERVVELDWWQSHELDEVRVTMVPAQHFSGRGLCDRDATLWGGYVLEGPAGRAYFAGDTGYGPHFEQIRRRFGPLRIAILPIGAYLPRWFMQGVHIDPAEAVRAHRELAPGVSLAMHFDTFALADEAQGQATRDLAAALEQTGVAAERFWVLGFGEGRDVPAAP